MRGLDISDASSLDFKVSRGIGAHGYRAVRITVIEGPGDGNGVDSKAFTYNAPFRHRWTNRTLHTVLINSSTPGKPTTYKIGVGANASIRFLLPPEGNAVRGVFFGDPCTEPGFVGCIHFNNTRPISSNMSQRLPLLFNALADVDFRVILGDNFYESTTTDGGIASRFFAKLSAAAKTQWQLTVPGNHDFWEVGSPLARLQRDQYGNGFLQYYGQDTMAGKISPADSPYNLSVDPGPAVNTDDANGDTILPKIGALPLASNYFFYHKIGNTGKSKSQNLSHVWCPLSI